MSEMWKEWVGRAVDGIPLLSYLGGSDHGAVFLTQGADGKNAVIKLIPADAADGEKQLQRWAAVRELKHTNLIRILAAGREGAALLYVVEECAEENLSQVLPERALTADEVKGVLPPILRALQYVHDKGFVHGHIRPSNILAIGDQVKLSSDTLGTAGEAMRSANATNAYDPPEAGTLSKAGDVWQLGMTLVEVLTQHLSVWDRTLGGAPEIPAALPQPFREIAEGCLQVDPEKRWPVAKIFDRLAPQAASAAASAAAPARAPASNPIQPPSAVSAAPIAPRQKTSRKWTFLLAVAAVAAIVFVLIPRPKPSSPVAEVQSMPAQPGAGENSQPASVATQTAEKPSSAVPEAVPEKKKVEGTAPSSIGDQKAAANVDTSSADASNVRKQSGEVAKKVMPEVLPAAGRTIQGTVKVRVMVGVDAAGNVTEAKLDSGSNSKYFDRIALEAARGWKFSAAEAGEQSEDRERKLLFAFSRSKTEASVLGAKR